MSWENLIKDQGIFPLVIILLFLITISWQSMDIKRKRSWHNGRGKERLLPFPSSHRPLSAFYCLIIGIPSRKFCGGESCYVPTLYMCNDRNVMVNSKPSDYLPEWGRYFSVSDSGGWEEKFLYHPLHGALHASWLGHCVPSLRIKFLVRKSNVPSLKNFSNSF